MTQAFELRRENHAIAEFHASVHLFQSVSGGAFARVSERLREIAKEFKLPAAIPIQIFQVSFTGQPSPQVASGVGYQRFAENGEVTMAVLADSDSVAITIRDYQGWELVVPTLLRIFTELLYEYMSEVPALQSVRLQYLNEFRASSVSQDSSAELYNENSHWLAPFVFEATGEWHCNVGRFLAVSADRRDLVNVNSACNRKPAELVDEPRLHVSTRIMAGCYYDIPGRSPLILEHDRLGAQLAEVLEAAHDLEKRVLAETLSPAYLQAVGASYDN